MYWSYYLRTSVSIQCAHNVEASNASLLMLSGFQFAFIFKI